MTNISNGRDLAPSPLAQLDPAHVGDIRGAFGSIAATDTLPRRGLAARLRTMLAIVGPGLIVMVGDNDAGAFSTYGQAGQNYGTALLWTILLLVPVLYVNQEMVVRLGVVTGVGHARLILERFGRFWGAFSVIDLFILNGLTIVTEFIGINLALGYLGLPRAWGMAVAAMIIIGAASTGSFRRFERFTMALCGFSLLLVPVFVMVHPPLGDIARDLVVPKLPGGDAKLSDVLLLVIAVVGTTVAPWQLFFQQSYIIDKRITPRFLSYERADLCIGIAVVVLGATAIISLTAAAVSNSEAFGAFTDTGTIARAVEAKAGRGAGVLFALALLDASIIGASAVSLSTAYAIGDVLSLKHSLHRKAADARGFYVVYAGLILAASALVLLGSDAMLGLLTNAVQTLAGVLLPSATVFLLLLCNDPAVLGPSVNGRWLNLFTGVVIWVLVMLSLVLTAATVFPELSGEAILTFLGGGAAVGLIAAVGVALLRGGRGGKTHGPGPRNGLPGLQLPPLSKLPPAAFIRGGLTMALGGALGSALARYVLCRVLGLAPREVARAQAEQANWRMPPLSTLPAPKLTLAKRVWMGVLRCYLMVAVLLVAWKVAQTALGS